MFLCNFNNAQLFTISVFYASGSSIAKFPKNGYLVTQTLKDQGKHDFCGSIKFMYCGCTIEGRTK